MNYRGEPFRTRILVSFPKTEEHAPALVSAAMQSARAAQRTWSQTTLSERLRLLRELRSLIVEHALSLASASASMRHRPIEESLTAEVAPLAEACRFLERNAKRILAPKRLGRSGRPLWLPGVRTEIHREPLGVVLIVGPGNYPLLLPGVQMLQALVAGNAVLLKPGREGTPAAAQLCELMARAGFDPRLFTLLPESPENVVAAIAAQPDKVLFTGSASTGEKILAQLAPRLIPATMELSGCDAVIVRADADLDLVVKALTFALQLNGGATCMSPKRVFVSAACATELEGRLAAALREGHPLPGDTRRLRELLEEALAQGAHFICGGVGRDGELLSPLVLGGVSPQSALLRDDFFGPLLSIVTVDDDHEAVSLANDCPYALTASVFTADENAARNLAARLHAGTVTINDLIIPTADARVPFGGRGRSGFGSTRGAEGLIELTAPKVVTLTRGTFRPAWESPRPADTPLFTSYLKLTHGRGLAMRAKALIALLRTVVQRTKTQEAES